eukprot:5216966-Alexandrium_andersonii.AAC.1
MRCKRLQSGRKRLHAMPKALQDVANGCKTLQSAANGYKTLQACCNVMQNNANVGNIATRCKHRANDCKRLQCAAKKRRGALQNVAKRYTIIQRAADGCEP